MKTSAGFQTGLWHVIKWSHGCASSGVFIRGVTSFIPRLPASYPGAYLSLECRLSVSRDILHRNTKHNLPRYHASASKWRKQISIEVFLPTKSCLSDTSTMQAKQTNYARDLHAEMVLPKLAFSWHRMKSHLLNTKISTWWHALTQHSKHC